MDAGLTEWRAYTQLSRQLTALEKARRQQAAEVQNWDARQFIVTPTCPPSTSIVVRGGRNVNVASGGGTSSYMLTSTLDLGANEPDAYGAWPYVCANAGWYLPIYLCLSYAGATYTGGYTSEPAFIFFGADYLSYSGGGFVEYQTAAEAEAAVDATDADFFQDHLNEAGLPLCRIILRIAGAGVCNFMAIDKVNRGRSYLWSQFRNGRYSV